MQPNYLPWIGYFNLIYNCDKFVFLDHVQYTKGEWINRNRIKNPTGWTYLTVPIKRKDLLHQPICKAEINNNKNWREAHWKSIKFNYARAPYFKEFESTFQKIYQKEWLCISDLNVELINKILDIFQFKKEIFFSSTLNIVGQQTDLIVNICKYLKADEYFSPLGAREYLEENKFKKNNIKLIYQTFSDNHPTYPQLWGNFITHLSVIDLIFNCGKDGFKYIKTYQLT